MEIIKSLVPNCSEFTFYVNMGTSSDEAKAKFQKFMDELEKHDETNVLEKYGLSNPLYPEHQEMFGLNIYILSGDTGDMGATVRKKLDEIDVKYESREN